tara:strand:+ start:465 stop:602 length:138 start_codon:yes stop_codon:yes gene_type:complete
MVSRDIDLVLKYDSRSERKSKPERRGRSTWAISVGAFYPVNYSIL